MTIDSWFNQVGFTERNPTYGNYEDGPQYNTALDNNPRYGENVRDWGGDRVTDVNSEYRIASSISYQKQ